MFNVVIYISCKQSYIKCTDTIHANKTKTEKETKPYLLLPHKLQKKLIS